MSMENALTPSGIEHATYRLVAQCLRQVPNLFCVKPVTKHLYIVVGTATRYRLDGPEFESRQRQDNFSKAVQTDLASHPASFSVSNGVLSRG
jgi:hypothetical protein